MRAARSPITSRSAGIRRAGTCARITYRELSGASSRFANVLRSLGVAQGRRGLRAVRRASPSSTSRCSAASSWVPRSRRSSPPSGRSRIATRVNLGRGKVLVTTEALFQRKVAKIAVRDAHAAARAARRHARSSARAFDSGLAAVARSSAPAPTTPSFLHFTSGTTGMPKGAVHVHGAVVDALRDRAGGARPARRRRLLVHRRSRAGSPAPPTASSRRSCTA